MLNYFSVIEQGLSKNGWYTPIKKIQGMFNKWTIYRSIGEYRDNAVTLTTECYFSPLDWVGEGEYGY